MAAESKVALIMLAAGFATRLEPKTLNIPKHLLPVSRDKVLMDLFFDTVSPHLGNFSKIILATNRRYKALFEKWALVVSREIRVIDNGVEAKEDRIGAVGDLLFALREAQVGTDAMVCAPDYIIPDADLGDFIRFAKRKQSSATIARVEPDESALRAGSCLKLNRGGFVSQFAEKPLKPFSNLYGVPYYYLLGKDIGHISKISRVLRDNIGQIVAKLVEDSRVAGYLYEGEVIHLTSGRDDLELVSGKSR